MGLQFTWIEANLLDFFLADVRNLRGKFDKIKDEFAINPAPIVVAYDPRRHQGMTLRRRRSRHPRASSPLDRRRRRMPSFTIPSEDLISPRHISQGSHARGVIFPVFPFIMNLFSPHVFERAFASLLPSLLGR